VRRLVASLHEKIKSIRDDSRQESRRYVDSYDVVEDIDIPIRWTGDIILLMTPRARQTLRRSIHGAAWGDFTRKLSSTRRRTLVNE